MNKIILIILIFALVVALCLLIKTGFDEVELQSLNDELNNELMQSNLELGRALTQFGDTQEYISELEENIQNEINERNALITRYGELETEFNVLKSNQSGSHTKIIREKVIVKIPLDLQLQSGMYYEAISSNELQLIQMIEGEFKDHRLFIHSRLYPRPKDTPKWEFDYELKLKVELQFVETYIPSGAINHYISAWEVDNNGNRIQKLNVTKFNMIVNKPLDKQWFWWAPHVDISGLLGAKLSPPNILLGGSLGFSPFGYGKTVNDLDWRFLRISLDLSSESIGLGCSPFTYNVGQWLPLFSNIWIGPHFIYFPFTQEVGIAISAGAVL